MERFAQNIPRDLLRRPTRGLLEQSLRVGSCCSCRDTSMEVAEERVAREEIASLRM